MPIVGAHRNTAMRVILAIAFASLVGCRPSTFVPSAPGWKSIELRKELRQDYGRARQVAVDSVARNYDIKILDKDSGYIRTAWKFGIMDQPTDAYAGRITLKFSSVADPENLELKTDAKWFTRRGWIEGFDSQLQRDFFTELSARLGRTTQ